MFYRWRTINEKQYLYREERWRENGKVRSRSTIVKGAAVPLSARGQARERYQEVLRSNAFEFGRTHPGERYKLEALAREEYQHFVDCENKGVPYNSPAMRFWVEKDAKPVSNFEVRERAYKMSNRSPADKAQSRQMELRTAAEKELAQQKQEPAQEKSYPPKGTPSDEEEAQHADRVDAARDANNTAATEYAETAADNDAPAGSQSDNNG